MSAPARAGAVIYAKNLEAISAFYEKLLSMARAYDGAEFHILESPDFQLVVHGIPPHIASEIVIQSPPIPRSETAIKLFFTTPSLAAARRDAPILGGAVFEETWDGPGFRACNACDPEGNIFQLREFTA
jgi:predicted enzyme related to lactoylglutathione lyase